MRISILIRIEREHCVQYSWVHRSRSLCNKRLRNRFDNSFGLRTCMSRYIALVLSFSEPSRFGTSTLKPNISAKAQNKLSGTRLLNGVIISPPARGVKWLSYSAGMSTILALSALVGCTNVLFAPHRDALRADRRIDALATLDSILFLEDDGRRKKGGYTECAADRCVVDAVSNRCRQGARFGARDTV